MILFFIKLALISTFFYLVISIILYLHFLYKNKKSKKANNSLPQTSNSISLTSYLQNHKSNTSQELFLKYVNLAKNSLENGNFKLAIFYYDKAIELKSSEPFCFNNRAHCKSQINDYQGAIEDYSKAINLNGNKSIYFANRGITYLEWGKKDEAIKDWETAALLGSKEAKKWLSQIGHYKGDWQEFENIIIQEGINKLYHFTDRSNLNSIKKYGGLFSWYTCEIKGIHIPVPGGNELSRDLDNRRNIQDYVRLSFNKNQPMLYVAKKEGRILKPVFLEISPEVILFKDTLFSDENATASSAIIGSELEDFQRINFKFAKSGEWSDELEKKYVQAEVLVKSHIPIKFIKNL